MRKLMGLLVLITGVWAVIAVFSEPTVDAEPRTFFSSQQCIACHAEVGAEWAESWHAQSWTDPLVRAPEQSNNFANTDCIDCHAPQPVFKTGIGERVLPRSIRQVEGVDCIACHMLPDGRVAGSMDDPTVACRPTARRELVRVDFCAGCHDQHGTVKQWTASKYPALKQTCLDCHMPEVERANGKRGRHHGSWGGHSLDMLQKAVQLDATKKEDGTWVAQVTNVGAGHNYPTDERSRASDVFWRPVETGASSGSGAWRHLYRIRNPYRFETEKIDTELPAGETKQIELPAEAANTTVEIALFYKLTPIWKNPEQPDPETDATCTLVHKQVFQP